MAILLNSWSVFLRGRRRRHGGQRGHALLVSSISCRFVLREVVSQSKDCCSLEVKMFGPSQIFGFATSLFTVASPCFLLTAVFCHLLSEFVVSHKREIVFWRAAWMWPCVGSLFRSMPTAESDESTSPIGYIPKTSFQLSSNFIFPFRIKRRWVDKSLKLWTKNLSMLLCQRNTSAIHPVVVGRSAAAFRLRTPTTELSPPSPRKKEVVHSCR